MNRLVRIIRSVLQGQKLSVKIGESLLSLAQFHSVAPFLYPCMDVQSTDKAVADKVTQIYFTALKRDVIQFNERESLEGQFEQSQIPHLSLKGMVMKSFYPQTHLRTMGDLDYLVPPSHFDKARRIICESGYKIETNCEQHLEFIKPPIMVVELHRLLINDDEMGRGLFENVIERCRVKKGYSYALEMSDEDFYLHLMLHLIKHLVVGGTGLRSFIDVYLYLKAKPDLDRSYIDLAFGSTDYVNTIKLVERFSIDLFDGNPLDGEELALLESVTNSGTYGTITNKSQAELQKTDNSVIKVVFRRLFPTVQAMKGWYPVLGKGAGIILLPFCYVWHVISRVFSRNSYRRINQLVKTKKQNSRNEKK